MLLQIILKITILFTVSSLKKRTKDSCIFIIVEFIRFSGFHPLTFQLQAKNNLWVFDESYKGTYEEYIEYKIDKSVILSNFKSSLVNLKTLDDNSDIKFYDYFINNYKRVNLFRDPTHISDTFIKYIITQIIEKMNITPSVDINKLTIPFSDGFKMRYIPILNCVKECLDLNFDDNFINFYNVLVDKKEFYEKIQMSVGLSNYETESLFVKR